MLDAILIFVGAVFALAGFTKGAIGLGLPTIAMGLLAVVMPPSCGDPHLALARHQRLAADGRPSTHGRDASAVADDACRLPWHLGSCGLMTGRLRGSGQRFSVWPCWFMR
jgi:hypothetical protein